MIGTQDMCGDSGIHELELFSGSTCGYPQVRRVSRSLTHTHPGQSTHPTRTRTTQPIILPAGVTRTDTWARPTHATP